MGRVVARTFVGLLVASLFVPGCGESPAKPDARPRADAHVPNYSCANQPVPNPLPDTITATGMVFQPGIPGISVDTPLPNILIQAFEVGSNRILSSTVSDENGDYVLVTQGETEPIDIFLKVSNAFYLESRLFPPRPPSADIEFDIPVFHIEDRDRVELRAEVEQQTDLAFAVVAVVDCDFFPVENAVVTATPAGSNIIYQDPLGFPHPNIEKTSHEGFAFIFNLPVGDVTFTASVDGVQFLPVTARVGRWTDGIIVGVGVGP